MNLIRQERLIKALVLYRFRKYGIGHVKVEAYDTFEDNKYMCRLEVFRSGTAIQNRLFKYEAFLDDRFIIEAEMRLTDILSEAY